MANHKTILMINVHEDDVLCFRKEVILDLAEQGYKMVLLYPVGTRSKEIICDNIIVENLKIDRHGCNPLKDFALLMRCRKAIKKYQPTMVLLYTIKPNIYGALAASSLCVPFINNITGIGSSMNGKETVLQAFVTFLYRIALKKTRHVFFQNAENRDMFLVKKICTKSNSSVIPGSGVDLKRFAYVEPVASDKIVFNYIGRVMRSKGIIEYIEAAKKIIVKHPECEFNILGFIENDEKELTSLLDKEQKNGHLIYRGAQSDIKPWIARSDAIILPSKYGEGMSNVLLETAAIGRSLITTRIPGCACLVENDNGFLFEPGNTEELISCIESFLTLSREERTEMGRRSRDLVERKYSREIVVHAYRKIVNEIDYNGGDK